MRNSEMRGRDRRGRKRGEGEVELCFDLSVSSPSLAFPSPSL